MEDKCPKWRKHGAALARIQPRRMARKLNPDRGRKAGYQMADANRIPAAVVQKVVVVNGNTEVLGMLETVLDAGRYDMVFVESSDHVGMGRSQREPENEDQSFTATDHGVAPADRRAASALVGRPERSASPNLTPASARLAI